MSVGKSICGYSNNCLNFLKRAVPSCGILYNHHIFIVQATGVNAMKRFIIVTGAPDDKLERLP